MCTQVECGTDAQFRARSVVASRQWRIAIYWSLKLRRHSLGGEPFQIKTHTGGVLCWAQPNVHRSAAEIIYGMEFEKKLCGQHTYTPLAMIKSCIMQAARGLWFLIDTN